jgi:hypothetical protein
VLGAIHNLWWILLFAHFLIIYINECTDREVESFFASLVSTAWEMGISFIYISPRRIEKDQYFQQNNF